MILHGTIAVLARDRTTAPGSPGPSSRSQDVVGARPPGGRGAPGLVAVALPGEVSAGLVGYHSHLLGGVAGSHFASVWIALMSSRPFAASRRMGSPVFPSAVNGMYAGVTALTPPSE